MSSTISTLHGLLRDAYPVFCRRRRPRRRPPGSGGAQPFFDKLIREFEVLRDHGFAEMTKRMANAESDYHDRMNDFVDRAWMRIMQEEIAPEFKQQECAVA